MRLFESRDILEITDIAPCSIRYTEYMSGHAKLSFRHPLTKQWFDVEINLEKNESLLDFLANFR